MSSPDKSPPAGRSRRRTLLLAATALASAVLLVVGTWLVALVFVSPQQIQAAATPPELKPILAEVTRGNLEDVRVVAGTFEYVGTRQALLSASKDATRTVVTGVSSPKGTELKAGSVVLTLNDSPVFAVVSPFAFYRDIGLGDKGPDVRALQDTLVAAGLLSSADGQFGGQTARAVERLFSNAGYPVPIRDAAADAASARTETNTEPSPSQTPRTVVKTTFMPLSNVLSVSALPAIVQAVPSVGELISDGATVTLSDATIVANAAVPSDVSADQLEGLTVTGTMQGGASFAGTLRKAVVGTPTSKTEGAAESSAGDPTAPAQTEKLLVYPDSSTSLGPDAIGTAVTMSVPIATVVQGELLVPSSAVSDTGTGESSVLVERDGSFERTRVQVLGQLAGVVALRPVDSPLAEGDKVRLG